MLAVNFRKVIVFCVSVSEEQLGVYCSQTVSDRVTRHPLKVLEAYLAKCKETNNCTF